MIRLTHNAELCNTLDVICSDLHRQGIGAEKHSAPVIKVEDERMFWEMGLLGYGSPKVLQRSVFFYVGLHFALRGVQEQHDLTPQQFVRFPPDVSVYNSSVYYQYTEFISKTNQHRFKDLNSEGKVSRAYAQVDVEHCVVKLLDSYLAKLPPKSPHFYMRALEKPPVSTSKPWYVKQRVGVNKLKEMLPSLSAASKCATKYTNHSLCATAATRMFAGSVPEKLVAEKTGHRSLKALRSYERTDTRMQMAIDAVISNTTNKFAVQALEPEPELTKTVSDEVSKENYVSTATKPPGSAGHTFSGVMNNCTINISYS